MHHLVPANLGRRALHDLLAAAHHRHVVGDGERDVHVVLDQDQRHIGGKAEQQLRQPLALALRQPGRRLVEQHQLRLDCSCHAHLELALLTVREVTHQSARLRTEEHSVGGRPGALSDAAIPLRFLKSRSLPPS